MKKGYLFATFVAMLFCLVMASPTYAAYTGIEGVALTSDGTTRWTAGGTVVVSVADSGDGGAYKTCTTNLTTAASDPGNPGYYSITFNSTDCPGLVGGVADFTIISVTASFNNGGGGIPPDYNGLLFNLATSTGIVYHDISTQSGPTAVSLQGMSAGVGSSNGLLLLAIAVMATITFVVVRRRLA